MCVIRYRAWQLCCHNVDQKVSTESCEGIPFFSLRRSPCENVRYEPIVAETGLCPRCAAVFAQADANWRALETRGEEAVIYSFVIRAAEHLRNQETANFQRYWQRRGPDHDGATIYQGLVGRIFFCVEMALRLVSTHEGPDAASLAERAFSAFYSLTKRHRGLGSLTLEDYRRVMSLTWQVADLERIAVDRDGWADRLQREMVVKCEQVASLLGLVGN
ncbi:hypothetical protein F5X99DRAFT_414589 [Biscogniauxia marginata]|nr:hypothetical protein F5X99DRAFT_414589 [Biscogniauxia marginata]